ncbi:MAG TPA: hypothetical protein VIU63_07660 [Nitrospira sp.]
MGLPDNLRKEVRELISLNEKIQSLVLTGDSLNDDEMEIVLMCAKELLQISSSAPRLSKFK